MLGQLSAATYLWRELSNFHHLGLVDVLLGLEVAVVDPFQEVVQLQEEVALGKMVQQKCSAPELTQELFSVHLVFWGNPFSACLQTSVSFVQFPQVRKHFLLLKE